MTERHCYLVLAHTAVQHFARLAEALCVSGDEMIVHVDGKVDIEPFRQTAGRLVYFTKRRINCKWSGFSLVEATLELLATGITETDAQRFTLLSGDSYPIYSPRRLHGYLQNHAGTQFINLLPMPAPAVGKSISRLNRRYFAYDPRTAGLNRYAYIVANRLIPQNWKRAFGDWQPYCGSQWWSLTRAAADFVMDAVRANPTFVRFCRHTAVPDEHFFHTIIGNSPYCDSIRPSLMFTEFRPDPAVAVAPSTISLRHVHAWQEMEKLEVTGPYGKQEPLFARKLTDDSADVVDAIRAGWAALLPTTHTAPTARGRM